MAKYFHEPPDYGRQPRSICFVFVLLAVTIGFIICAGTSQGDVRRTEGAPLDAPATNVSRVGRIVLTADMFQGVAPGLRITLGAGEEYYFLGPDVHAGSGSSVPHFPTGMFKKPVGGRGYLRIDARVPLALDAVREVHLVGRRGFAGLGGQKARNFLRSLAYRDFLGRKSGLSSMFTAARSRSFSLYVGSSENAVIRYPASADPHAPWQFGELITADLSPAYKDLRVIDNGHDSFRREHVWVFHHDRWARLQDVVGHRTGYSGESDKLYIVLITDHFRAGETTMGNRESSIGDYLTWPWSSRDEPSRPAGPGSSTARSYHGELVALWSSVGPRLWSTLAKNNIKRVYFFARSRASGRFLSLRSIENLSDVRSLNQFLGAFSGIKSRDQNELYSGEHLSLDPGATVRSFVADPSTAIDPRTPIVVLDQPGGSPCIVRSQVRLPGRYVTNLTVRFAIVNGFLTSAKDQLDRLFSAALASNPKGEEQCER